MIRSIYITAVIFVFLINANVSGDNDQEPEQLKYEIVRLNKNTTSYTKKFKTLYLPEYEVNVTLNPPNCNWLEWEISESEDEVEYTFRIIETFKNSPDLRVEFHTREKAVKDPDGNYGDYDPDENTYDEEPPTDLRTTWIFQWDPCPSANTDSEKIPQLTLEFPEDGADQYTLFGNKDDEAVCEQEEIDYFRFMPTEASGQICMAFPSGYRSENIVVNIGQFNEGQFEVKKAVTITPSHSGFKPLLEFENLTLNVTAYIKISFLNYANTRNLDYKLAVFSCKKISETANWEEDGDIVNCTSDSTPVFVAFTNIKDIIAFQVSTENIYSLSFYNDRFERISNNLSPKLNMKGADRYCLTQLENNKYTFVKLTANTYLDNTYKLKLSRLKPVILVHGIDASPWYEGDGTSFGDLIKNEQYYDIRPYVAHDFPWRSTLSIKRKYVGNGTRNGTLGAYIASKRDNDDLKAAIVAHSAGCLMTYYFCQEHNNKFKESVDSILFCAPPMLGSALADRNYTKPLSLVFKRTSGENFDLIARGTKANWMRGTTQFKFPASKATVIYGTRRNITIPEATITSIDSLWKYKNYKLLLDPRLHFDAWYDLFVDSIESGGEYEIGRAHV